MSDDIDAYLAFAHRLADLAAEAILPWFRRPHDIINKANMGAFDPVTAADRAAEEAMRSAISEAWPEHGMVGEEFEAVRADAEFTWIMDPIDGTRGFIIGLPVWGTVIGLASAGEVQLGVMNQPFTGDRFWSAAGAAYHRHGTGEQAIRTRPCPSLDQASLAASCPDMFAEGYERERFEAVTREVRMRRFGTDCYAYCLMAAGHLDLVVEADLKTYDIAGLIPIVENAGGRISTWEGGSALGGGRIVASGDPRIHDRALEILNR